MFQGADLGIRVEYKNGERLFYVTRDGKRVYLKPRPIAEVLREADLLPKV